MEHRNAASSVLELSQQRAMKNTTATAVLPLLPSVPPGSIRTSGSCSPGLVGARINRAHTLDFRPTSGSDGVNLPTDSQTHKHKMLL